MPQSPPLADCRESLSRWERAAIRSTIDPAEQIEGHGADLLVPEWAARLRRSQCGSREVDSIVRPLSHGVLRRWRRSSV